MSFKRYYSAFTIIQYVCMGNNFNAAATINNTSSINSSHNNNNYKKKNIKSKNIYAVKNTDMISTHKKSNGNNKKKNI